MRGRGQDGMTLVEVLVAATILVVGVATAVTALNGSRRLTLKSERVDQAVAVGQREIERMRAMSFEDIGTTTLPQTTADQPSGLNLLVSVSGVLRLKVTVPPHGEQLVPATAAGQPFFSCIAPASVANTTACPAAGRISSGATRGGVYRYVTYADSCAAVVVLDLCSDVYPLQALSATKQAKRVTVVVALDPVNGQTTTPVQTDTVVAS